MAGFAEQPKQGVFAYLTAPAATTCTLADTFYPVQGTFTNNPLEGFSLGATALVYNGVDRYFEVDYHVTMSGNVANVTAHLGVAIAGEVLTIPSPRAMGTFLKNIGQLYALSGTLVVMLSAGDTIQLQCAADGAGDILTFAHFTTTIRRFFD